METVIHGSPSFAYIDAQLDPGESIVTESDAMATMAAELDLKARFNGGIISAICKRFLGGNRSSLANTPTTVQTP